MHSLHHHWFPLLLFLVNQQTEELRKIHLSDHAYDYSNYQPFILIIYSRPFVLYYCNSLDVYRTGHTELEGRKRRRNELKPHVLALPASCDNSSTDDGSFKFGVKNTVDDFWIIGNDALGYPLPDTVLFLQVCYCYANYWFDMMLLLC